MKVTVVIPLYNKAPFIKETIESVLQQSYQDFELLIIDDGSTDHSQEVVNSIIDPRIKFHQNSQNLGTAGNGNKCFELTKTPYLIRLDADDLMVPNRIQLQLDFMEKNPEISASSGELITFGSLEKEHWKPALSHNEIHAKILFHTPIIQGAAIVRTDFVFKNNITYNVDGPQIGEDWIFWFKMAMKGARFANIPEILIRYRKDSDNITNYGQHKFYENRKLMYIYFFTQLGLPLEKVDIHFLTKPYFVNNFNDDYITDFFNWCNYLKEWNRIQNTFDQNEFNKVIQEKWDRLFYFLPEKGKNAVKKYKLNNNGLNSQQRLYNFKFNVKKNFGLK